MRDTLMFLSLRYYSHNSKSSRWRFEIGWHN